jgi:hypothetical protein
MDDHVHGTKIGQVFVHTTELEIVCAKCGVSFIVPFKSKVDVTAMVMRESTVQAEVHRHGYRLSESRYVAPTYIGPREWGDLICDGCQEEERHEQRRRHPGG